MHTIHCQMLKQPTKMRSFNTAWLLLSILILLVLVIILITGPAPNRTFVHQTLHEAQNNLTRFLPQDSKTTPIEIDSSLVQNQRNLLSSVAMRLSREFHQYQCEKEPDKISGSGGWCRKDASVEGTQHKTDHSLAKELTLFFSNQTVASFGEGPGSYKKLIENSNQGVIYDGFDGSPFCEESTNGAVKYLDLTIPVFGLKIYDWVISLEVAEHIPREHEQTYLDNVANHARKGIVLSWATPDQTGHGHVNCKALDYVKQQLGDRGFSHSPQQSAALIAKTGIKWLRKNMNVYLRQPRNPVCVSCA